MPLTESSARSLTPPTIVNTVTGLQQIGFTEDEIRAQLDAHRWQRFGAVILAHNGTPTLRQQRAIALLNCGPRAALTAFSSVEHFGVDGWTRTTTHVLVPSGTHVRRHAAAPLHVHYISDWSRAQLVPGRRIQQLAPAALRAASTFRTARPGAGLLAAAVQQNLATTDDLRDAWNAAPRARHHRLLGLAIADIAQGAQALSEIDFVRLCTRYRLPAPRQQAVRVEPSGQRRYLDAEWIRHDGRRVVAEVDGALHLVAKRWWDDQFRQNELAISGDLVLRFPSVVVRTDPDVVADQLRRMLRI